MIFRKHKIIFLHIPRTGGTSIEVALAWPKRPYLIEASEPIWNKHLDAYRAEALWPDEWRDPNYRIITVIRDPRDLVVSQYIQNRLKPTVDGFRGWLRRLDPARDNLYLTAAEVDRHEPQYIADIPDAPSAGWSITRFLQFRGPENCIFINFSTIGPEFLTLTGLKLPHTNRRKRRKNYHEFFDRYGREKFDAISRERESDDLLTKLSMC